MQNHELSDQLNHQEQLELSRYVATIYRQAQQLEINEFRNYCLDSLQEFINFQGAIWFNRREQELKFTDLETFLYQLPENFMENYNEYISKAYLNEDPLGKYGLERPNVVFTLEDVYPDREEFIKSDLNKNHCQKFEQSDTLTGLYTTGLDDKIQVVALYKFRNQQTFNSKDKAIKKIIDPHFAEAMSMNILANFNRQCHSSDMCRAIADIHGNILEAEDAFTQSLIEHNNATTTKVDLPDLKANLAIEGFLADGTPVKCLLKDTLVLIEIKKEVKALINLTNKQLEVCDLLKDGLSDKAIAAKLNISANTVSNHLKAIYKRLDTKNRVGTLAYISQHS
ncbi:helix-turn-helix transcriptional regulator [Thalassotalea psychrophila]|uniref:Helix-turn-helix transcriptional regulator n=1 Tax=Thalassotalea psychrophila TaxID=3065647 RepID=A0ABY9TY01_9GAMM|nr:helix-turn-helix transcriptional regulator [Colwelliaceae bacterium SQ149]